MFLPRFGNITVAAGQGLELQVVAAVVVGGVNIFGGVGSIGRRAARRPPDRPPVAEPHPAGWASAEFLRDALLGLLILLAVAVDSVILARLRAGWQCGPAPARWRGVTADGGRRCADVAPLPAHLGRAPAGPADRGRRRQRDRVPGYLQLAEPGQPVRSSAIEKAIVVLAMAFVIIGGEIDLSVASIMGLAAILFAWAARPGRRHRDRRLCSRSAVGAPVRTLQRLLGRRSSGCRHSPSRSPALIGYRGLARMLIEDGSLGGFPDWFDTLGQRPVLGPIPFSRPVLLRAADRAAVVLHRTGFGRLRLRRREQHGRGPVLGRPGVARQGEPCSS